MEEIIERIKASENPPTRQDIADLLASIAPPGYKLGTKRKAIKELFAQMAHLPLNTQGHSVLDDLESWVEF